MAQGFRRKWKNFFRIPAVKITTKVFSTIFKCILTIFLIGVITASMVGCVLVVYVVTSFDVSESVPDLDSISLNQSSSILVKDQATGEFVEHQRVEGSKMVWKDLDQIPINLRYAVISIEDERFEDHYGVDWKRTISAFVNLIFHFSSQEYGGSTITQQLIKIITEDDRHSIERKISEIFQAIELERQCSKEQILETYLNLLPLGAVNGVGAGANYFFGKDVEDLTLAECAYLASITKGPSLYSPYLHPENARRRQQTVLYKMYEQGYITAEEYKQAAAEEVNFHSSIKYEAVQDYYTDLLIENVIADLMDAYGCTYQYAESMVFHGGLKIYSAEIPEQQAKVEAIFADESNFPKPIATDKEDPQAAIFIMDYDGRVVATVGGRGEKTANRVQNRATMAKRQIGSAIKPLAAYTPAIEMNLVHYSTPMNDHPITLSNGSEWPPNYGSKPGVYSYKDQPLEFALQNSTNTTAAQLVEMLTPQKSFDFVTQKLFFTTLVKGEKRNGQVFTDIDYSPMALGGMTDGVYCSEVTAAYQIFGNGGFYNEPYTYYKVTVMEKSTERLLLETKKSSIRAVQEDTAYVMNRMMQRVIYGPSGTAKELARDWEDWHIFGKTGTTGSTQYTRDKYFAGGTPYFVGACWMGYDYNKELNNSQNSTRILWNKSMQALHEGLELKDYALKGNVVEAKYCYQSGLLATDDCPRTELGVYRPSNVPGYCTMHGASATQPNTTGTPTTGTTRGNTATWTTQLPTSAPGTTASSETAATDTTTAPAA